MSEPVVIREGAAQRTVEELELQLIADVADLAEVSGTFDQITKATRLLDKARAAFDDPSLDLEQLITDLEWWAGKAEDLLADMGYWIEWDDGYLIYKDEKGRDMKCADCGNEVGPLEIFPKQRCLECHAAAPEVKRDIETMTAERLSRMWGA